MLGLGNSIQVSRDRTLPVILHQAGSWKYQVDKGKRPLYQGTSIPGGTDNPQTWSDLLGREKNEEKEAEWPGGVLEKSSKLTVNMNYLSPSLSRLGEFCNQLQWWERVGFHLALT